MKKTCLLLVLILLLTGCGGKENTSGDLDNNKNNGMQVDLPKKPEKKEEPKGYVFEYNDTVIAMNEKAAPILEKLGEPMEYFEAESCAFEGLDKIYTYSGFELHTYEMKGTDYVASVMFLDDSVSTKKGIYLYCNLDDVLSMYGDDYAKDLGLYTYELDKSKISFLIENDKVVSIEYIAITG
ncbi:MAG: hypothetical protein WBI21_01575 [Natronincolaceae bacterium]|nr:hypothetical protein [Bacillota bacterium]